MVGDDEANMVGVCNDQIWVVMDDLKPSTVNYQIVTKVFFLQVYLIKEILFNLTSVVLVDIYPTGVGYWELSKKSSFLSLESAIQMSTSTIESLVYRPFLMGNKLFQVNQ